MGYWQKVVQIPMKRCRSLSSVRDTTCVKGTTILLALIEPPLIFILIELTSRQNTVRGRIQIHFSLQTNLKITAFVLPYRRKGYRRRPQRVKNLLQNRIKTNFYAECGKKIGESLIKEVSVSEIK